MITLNIIPYYPYKYGLDYFSLFMISLGSVVLVSILDLYYKRIPKNNFVNTEIEAPIYTLKDILFQERESQVSDFPIREKTSLFIKIIIFILTILVIITPLFELFGIAYFL